MGRLLVRDGTVLTMEPGDAPRRADVLVEYDRIAAIDTHIEADARVVDARDCIVLPGFIDTHRHTWQSALRGVCADMVLGDYFRGVRFQASAHYRPEDVQVANHAGMLEALHAGVTTVLDFSHCIRTAEHADAAIDGTQAAGIRSQFAIGLNNVPGEDAGMAAPGGRLALARRLREGRLHSDRGLVTMGLAVSDLPEVGQERVIEEIAAAREWGLRSTFNAVAILFHEPVDDVEILDREGVLGPDLVWVHMNYASDAQLRRVAESGGAIASCPECELAAGIGRPVTERFLRAGGRPTFGVDMVPYISGDLLTQARIAMQVGRLLGADEGMAAGRAPKEVAPDCETVLRALTVWGAEALGLGDRIGTLRVGKQADLLVVRGDDPNTFPVHDPYATVVAQTQPHNIDTVVVAGEVRKSKRRLAAEWAPVRERLRESAAFLTETVAKNGGFQPQPPVELPW